MSVRLISNFLLDIELFTTHVCSKLMRIVVRTRIIGDDSDSNSEFERQIEDDLKPGFEFGFRLNDEFTIQ